MSERTPIWSFDDAMGHLVEQLNAPDVEWDHCVYITKCIELAYGPPMDDVMEYAMADARIAELGNPCRYPVMDLLDELRRSL